MGYAAGYLAAVRNVACAVPRLDDLEAPLDIMVKRLMGEADRVIYSFTLTSAGAQLISGRATVVLL